MSNTDGTVPEEALVDGRSLAAQFKELARTAVTVQRTLDHAYAADLAIRSNGAGPGPEDGLLGTLMPSRPALAALEIEARFELRAERRSGAEVGLALFGRPVHAFFELRHRQARAASARVRLEVEAAPLPLAAQSTGE